MSDLRIKLLCKCCGKVHDLPRTEEIPVEVTALACNYCIECEDKMQDYYNEWYIDDPNQLKIF